MRRIVLAALAMVLLMPGPAWAHPNVIASGPIVAGQPLRLTLLVLGDEGGFTGVDVTLPVSVTVDAVSAQSFTTAVSGNSFTLRGGNAPVGSTKLVIVDVTPAQARPIEVQIVSHLTDGKDFRYPALRVGLDGRPIGQDGSGSSASRWLVPAGTLLAVGGGVAFAWRRRYSKP